ncbi:MAG: hypothetical protein ACXVDD_08050, partial [Polyangia bacterium]
PVAAQELQLAPPSLTARADRCTAHLRSVCQGGGGGQRALESELSCEACGPAPMPPELVAPKPAAATGKQRDDGECLPRAAGPRPAFCAEPPRLDHVPRL